MGPALSGTGQLRVRIVAIKVTWLSLHGGYFGDSGRLIPAIKGLCFRIKLAGTR